MSKTLNTYITALDYADKTLLVFSAACNRISLCSLNTVIDIPVWTASTAPGLVLLSVMGLWKCFWKQLGEKNERRKIALLARSKLNRIEKINFQDVFKICLQDFFKGSPRKHLANTSWRHLKDVLEEEKMFCSVFKTTHIFWARSYWQGIRSCLRCIWGNTDLRIVLVGCLQETEQELGNSEKKRESRYSYRNEIDKVSVSSRRWHKKISKIYQEERFLTNYCVTKHLKLQVIYSMADISMELHQQFTILW